MGTKNIRADMDFRNELEKIKLERLNRKLDRQMQSDRRLTKAMIRSMHWGNIRKSLCESHLEDDRNKRGRKLKFNNKAQSFFDIFVVMGLIFFMLICFGVTMWFSSVLYTSVSEAVRGSDTSMVNLTQINDDTFGSFYNAMKGLRLISFVIIFGMIIMILLSNFLVKENPIYFLFYILMTIIGVVLSVFISNAYESVLNSSGEIAPFLTSLKEGTFVMLHLPYIVAVIGIFGLIFLLIGVLRDTENTGGFEYG